MLADLPPEVLRLILNGPASWAAIELWKAGDARLTRKLINGGVTEIDLFDPIEQSSSRWPTCLKYFQLSRLRVHRYNAHLASSTSVLRSELRKLSGCLKELEIFCEGLPECFSMNSVVCHGQFSWRQPKKPKFEEFPYSESIYGEALDMSALWPQLERLTLGRNPFVSSWLELCPATLPSSLLHLSLFFQVIFKDVAFPPGLLSLVSLSKPATPNDLPLLPSSLTELSMDEQAAVALIKDPFLLPHVVIPHLKTRCEGWASRQVLATTFECADLPPVLSDLPSSLQRLKLEHFDWDAVEPTHWMPSLTRLTLTGYGERRFGIDDFHRLPRTLLALHVDTLSTREEYSVAHLHRLGRRSLVLDSWSKEKQATIKRAAQIAGYDPTEYIGAVEAGGLFGLPLSLTSLTGEMSSLLLAPPNLREFDCHGSFRPNNSIFALLPPLVHGHHFKICVLPTNEDAAAAKNGQPPSDIASSAFAKSNITRLDLKGFEWFCPGYLHRFLVLPSKLKQLTLDCGRMPSSQVLRDLPATLEFFDSVNMTVPSTDLDWACLLPRGLTTLYVPRMPLIGHHIADLPPLLERLSVSMWNVKLAQVFQLPRNLRHLRVSATNADSEENDSLIGFGSWQTLCKAYRPFFLIREADTWYLGHLLNHKRHKNVQKSRDCQTMEQFLAGAAPFRDRTQPAPFP